MATRAEEIAFDAALLSKGEITTSVFLKRHGLNAAKMFLPDGAKTLVDIGHGLYRGINRDAAKELDRSRYFSAPGQRQLATFIQEMNYGLALIIGAPGTAKTTLAGCIAQRWRSRMQLYMVLDRGPVTRAWRAVLKGTPWHPIEFSKAAIESLPKNSGLFIQDAARVLDSRDYGNNIESAFSRLEEITRHRHIPIVLDCQNSSMLSKRAFMSAVRLFAYKPLGPGWREMEREGMLWLARKAQLAFDEQIPPTMPEGTCALDDPPCGWLHYAFVHCAEVQFEGFMHHRRPAWYSKTLSEFHGYEADEDIIEGELIPPKGRQPGLLAEGMEDGEFREVD